MAINQRKKQKEIDKAIANMIKYGNQEQWSTRRDEFIRTLLSDVADSVEAPFYEFCQTLEQNDMMEMIFPYLYEIYAVCVWDDDELSLIDEYLKRRGWREGQHGRRYLQALAKSEAYLWEVTEVNPGYWVEVRLSGSTQKSIRVDEYSASQKLKRWDCIATRVISLDGKNVFSGGILPFSAHHAQEVPDFIERTYQATITSFKEIRDENDPSLWTDTDIEEMAKEDLNDRMPDLLFSIWTRQVYLLLTKPMPTMFNRDGHALRWSKIKFPVKTNDITEIENRLHDASQLDYNHDSKEWVWLNCDKNNIPDAGATVLGHVSVTDKQVLARVNSNERAVEIKNIIGALLGGLIGTPLSVYENFEPKPEGASPRAFPSGETALPDESISAFMDQYYRKILDEPVPALNNQTPRACSEKKDQHPLLIQWLKGLENSTLGDSSMSHYDFKWMWEELGLDPSEK